MIMSMTGYGRSIMHIDDSDITVEIRSVNNRFADISVKMPRSLSYCEDKVKTELLKRVNRGKIDVFISYQKPQGEQVEIEPNISAASGYYDALKKIDAELGTHTEINANMLARFSDVFVVTREVPDEEKVWSDIRQVLTAAADNFNAMRAAEGEKMAEDVLGKIANVEELVLKVEAASEPRVEAYRNKLYNRLLDVLSNSDIDEKRILDYFLYLFLFHYFLYLFLFHYFLFLFHFHYFFYFFFSFALLKQGFLNQQNLIKLFFYLYYLLIQDI